MLYIYIALLIINFIYKPIYNIYELYVLYRDLYTKYIVVYI